MIEAEPFYADAFAQYESGRFEDAIEAFRLLCFQYPLEGKYWFGLAASLQEGKQYNDALQAWAVASVIKQTDPYPHFHAAECYFSLQNLDEALMALDAASEHAGQNEDLQEKIALLRQQWRS